MSVSLCAPDLGCGAVFQFYTLLVLACLYSGIITCIQLVWKTFLHKCVLATVIITTIAIISEVRIKIAIILYEARDSN